MWSIACRTHVPRRMFAVILPTCRVVVDIVPKSVQFFVVADDSLVIVSLPYREPRCDAHFVDPFRAGGFEPGDQRPERFRWPV